MKKTFIIVLIFSISLFTSAQNFVPCSNINSGPNTNYCCGHDPLLKTQLKSHRLLQDWNNGNHFCDDSNYDLVHVGSNAPIVGNWFLVWHDEFDEVLYCEEILLLNSTTNHSIDLNYLQKGIHFLSIEKDGNVHTEKIVIQ